MEGERHLHEVWLIEGGDHSFLFMASVKMAPFGESHNLIYLRCLPLFRPLSPKTGGAKREEEAKREIK